MAGMAEPGNAYERPRSALCRWGVYVILDRHIAGKPHLEIARAAIAGGARVIQLRDKTAPFEELVETGRALRAVTRDAGVTLIVNDNPYLAVEVEADGVHLGQNDFPPETARDIVGPEMIVGLSTHNKEQALRAEFEPVDYIGVGPVFPTQSKESEWKPLGVSHVAWVKRTLRLPVVAIGGITLETLGEVVASGADNAAIIGDIMRSEDIAARVRQLAARWSQTAP